MMSEQGKRKGKWHRSLRIMAVVLALMIVVQALSPVAFQAITALAENDKLNQIYGALSDSVGEPETVQDYSDLANIEIGRRNYDKALEYLEAARGLCSEESDQALLGELWLRSASVLVVTGKIDEARTALDQALRFNPESADALLIRAQLAMEEKNYTAAAADLQSYLKLNPTEANALLTLAQLTETIADYAGAEEAYRKLYQLQPEDDSHLLNAERCVFLDGRYEESAKGFGEYIEAHKADAENSFLGIANFLRAASQMQLGKYAEAVEGYRAAIAAGYDEIVCQEQIVACSFELNDHEAVAAAGDRVAELNGALTAPDAFYQKYGAALLQLERFEDALAALDKSAAANPALVGNNYYRGVTLLSLGRYDEAVEAFTKSIDENFLVQYCYYNRGVCHVQTLNYDSAVDDMVMVLSSGSEQTLIEAAQDVLWQLVAYYEQQAATQTDISGTAQGEMPSDPVTTP
ncbi:MAG: tetratricopeptide repeat protein [Clostridia bacterium]|nr:tetratricopeptide repeat protein [Clostridia bacterium]